MMAILLEDVRSILNVGGVFRIADATEARLLLTGYTPRPIDRMGRVSAKLSKTALGAEKTVPWSQYSTTEEALKNNPEYTPIVVEQTDRAVPYTENAVSNPLFIFGNEVHGVSQETRDAVQTHIYLPMRGKKESLNITTCVAVVAYHLLSG